MIRGINSIMSEEKKTEKEFEPIIVSEPRPRYGVLRDISLYIHPLSAPNIGEGDGYIEIGNINASNTILIENTCTFTDRDASCYRLAVADINKIQIKFIKYRLYSLLSELLPQKLFKISIAIIIRRGRIHKRNYSFYPMVGSIPSFKIDPT